MDERRLHAARIAALYALGKPAYATSIALGAILMVALWVPYATALLLGWFAALVAVSAARAVLHWQYAKAPNAPAEPLRWENRFALGAFASGAAWAFAAVVFFPEGDPILQVAVILVIGGAIVGATGLYAPSMKAVYAFSAPPLLAVTLQLLAQPALAYRLVAVSIVVFGLVMARMAHQMRRNIAENIASNMRNEDLLARARASEAQLRDAIESFPEGIAIWSAEDRLVVCNEAYARIYGGGCTPEELVGTSFRAIAENAYDAEHVAPEQRERREEWIARRVALHREGRGEANQYRTRDGRWCRGSTMRMRDGGYVGVVSDVTDLKRAQEAYLKVLAEEHLVLDTLPVGVAFVEENLIVRCNRRLEQMLGYEGGELQGRSTRAWFASEEKWLAARKETYGRLQGSGFMEGDARVRRKDGSSLWCRVLARALDPAAPSDSSIIFTFADADQRVAAERALKRSEEMYRNLVETSSELIWSLDREGRWTYLNAAGARRIYGAEAADMVGRPLTEFVARELRERDHAVFSGVLSGQTVFNHETRHERRDGRYVDLSFNAIALRDAAGGIVGATGTARDVSEEKRAAAALQESVEKLRLAVDAADLYYWEWEAETDRVHWGRDPGTLPRDAEGAELKWARYIEQIHPEDRERYLAIGRGAIEHAEPFEMEYRIIAQDGDIRWFAARGVPVLDRSGRVARMIGVSQDITERKRREDAVRFLAYHDSLTGLPNRRLLDDRLKQALYRAQRRDNKVVAMLVDLDNFKQVNDSAGHRAGDAVLREVAQRLEGCVRKADTLARHGGDEFIVVISDLQAEADCRLVAEKILGALSEPFVVDGASFTLGASIGISVFPSDAGDREALLRNADAAMYRAKQMGRNQYRFYGR